MQTASNYDLATDYIGKIFITLFDKWPIPTALTAESLTGITFDTEMLFYSQAPVRQPREWDICAELYTWLEREGYIVLGSYGGSVWDVYEVTLTQKALECLKQLPDPLAPDKRSFLDALRSTASSGLAEARQQLISQGMSSLFKYVSGS